MRVQSINNYLQTNKQKLPFKAKPEIDKLSLANVGGIISEGIKYALTPKSGELISEIDKIAAKENNLRISAFKYYAQSFLSLNITTGNIDKYWVLGADKFKTPQELGEGVIDALKRLQNGAFL